MKELHELFGTLHDGELAARRRLAGLHMQQDDLKQDRRDEAAYCLGELVPNLKMRTVLKLQELVPGFAVKTIKGWLWGEKVDPQEDIDLVRIRLGIFLDNLPKDQPKVWLKHIPAIDTEIGNREELITATEKEIAEIVKRIDAVTRLMQGGFDRLPPDGKTQVLQAAKAAQLSRETMTKPVSGSPVPAPVQSKTNSSNDPDLTAQWLWYVLLNDIILGDNSPLVLGEPIAKHHGHDDAVMLESGADRDKSNHHHGSDEPLPEQTHGHDHHHDTLAHHVDLGSQAFS